MARTRRGRGGAQASGGAGGTRRCVEPGCRRGAVRGSRWCQVHVRGEAARAEDRGMRALLADLITVGAGPATGDGDVRKREGELWRRAARGDYGELLDERLAGVMAAGEEGRIKGLLGQLIGAVAIALDGVMTAEGDDSADPVARTLAVSRLAQATTRIVGARERLAAGEAARGTGRAHEALVALLTEFDAEDDARRAREREQREQGAGAEDGAGGWAEWTGGEATDAEGEGWS